MKALRRPAAPDEHGVVALLVAVLAVVLVGVLAFVSDFGAAFANQRSLQNGVDAAALATARKIALEAPGSATCASIQTTYNDALTRTYATNAFGRNVGAGAALEPGSAGFAVTCETVAGNPQTVVVTVRGGQNSPTFFGGLFGQSSIPVSQAAKAIVGPLGTVVGLRPFAICEAFADQVQGNPGTTFVVPVTQANAGCGTAPGNWAMLDFNGGSNPTGDVKDWIQSGYQYPISTNPPLLISGDPGFNVNSAQTQMDIMFSLHDVVLPVYNSVTGTGSNSQFNIVGFISVTPCRYKINNKTGPSAASVNAGCAALPATLPSDYIQLKYSAYIPLGQLNLSCPLGTDLCDDGPRGTTLAD